MIGVVMVLVTILGSFVCCFVGPLVTSVWSLVDMVMILTGSLKDANGHALE